MPVIVQKLTESVFMALLFLFAIVTNTKLLTDTKNVLLNENIAEDANPLHDVHRDGKYFCFRLSAIKHNSEFNRQNLLTVV